MSFLQKYKSTVIVVVVIVRAMSFRNKLYSDGYEIAKKSSNIIS